MRACKTLFKTLLATIAHTKVIQKHFILNGRIKHIIHSISRYKNTFEIHYGTHLFTVSFINSLILAFHFLFCLCTTFKLLKYNYTIEDSRTLNPSMLITYPIALVCARSVYI